MKVRLKLELHFTRIGGELRLEMTRFSHQPAAAPVEMHAVVSGEGGDNVFRWENGQRALCVLFLKAFLETAPTLGVLDGQLAKSLHEVLRMKSAKGGGLTWVQKMFNRDGTKKSDPRLPSDLFRHSRQRVSLGRQWKGGELTVTLDGESIAASQFSALVNELAARTSPGEFSLSVDVLIAPATARSVDAFKSVSPEILPVRAGQMLQIKAQVSRPAFLLVMWVAPTGAVQPIYPGVPGHWPTPEELKQASRTSNLVLPVLNPDGTSKGWIFDEDAGMETLVVVAKSKPFTIDACEALKEAVHRRPPMGADTCRVVGPFKVDLAAITPSLGRILFDGPPLRDVVAELHTEIARALAGRCDAGAAVSFANKGTSA